MIEQELSKQLETVIKQRDAALARIRELSAQLAEAEKQRDGFRAAQMAAGQRNVELEAQLAEADATIAHLRKAKDCYYDCVDKAEANQRIASAEKAAMDIARPLVEKAEADAARLRAALEIVEWISRYSILHCPWCGGHMKDGHRPDCARQAALSPQPSAEAHWKPEDGWPAGEALAAWGKEGEK